MGPSACRRADGALSALPSAEAYTAGGLVLRIPERTTALERREGVFGSVRCARAQGHSGMN
eukprot:181849-Alexandrium_andersonii.AAC.1